MEQTNAWYDVKTKQEVFNRTVFEKIEVCVTTYHLRQWRYVELKHNYAPTNICIY